MKLSILIPTIPSRLQTYLPKMLAQVNTQIGSREDIEVIALYDNKKRSIGQKRNALLDLAQGSHLVFLDDDDSISDDYISSVMEVLDKSHPDCIVYDCLCTVTMPNRKILYPCKYGTEFGYKSGPPGSLWPVTTPDSYFYEQWTGKPSHTMVWKTSVAQHQRYKNISNAEDVDWAKRAVFGIKTQHRIDKIMYFYDADRSKSEYRKDLQGIPGI